MSKYKLIQLTNKSIGEIAVGDYLPLGLVSRRINSTSNNCATFNIASSTADTLYINEPGYYKVTYSASLNASATGNIGVTLVTNGQDMYSVNETVAAAGDYINLTLPYVIRVCPNCCSAPYNCPVAVQFRLDDVATSATDLSTANAIVEKIY